VGKLEGDPATTKGYYDIFREDRNPMAQENGSSSNRTGHRSTR
jgi:ribulose-bisphosphate carboxylase large chain